MSLYDSVASSRDGLRRLASARLRYRALEVLNVALSKSGKTKSEVAKALGVRKSAVSQVFLGDGNLRINTLAEYMFAMGYELELQAMPVGESRDRALPGPIRLDLIWDSAREMSPIDQSGYFRPDAVHRWDDELAAQ